MKSWRDEGGRFGVRLFFEETELEAMGDDLRRRAGPKAFAEGTGVDVERVLFKAFGIEADYVELPEGVLGRTLFESDGSARIEVCRRLAEEAETDVLARRRVRTTLAHEGGHVACHAQLFLQDAMTMPLFPAAEDREKKPSILCRAEGVSKLGYSGDWVEYQANQVMVPLLMPRKLFSERARAILVSSGLGSFEEAIRRGCETDLIRALADCFDVSHETTFYRLQALGFVPRVGPPQLDLGRAS